MTKSDVSILILFFTIAFLNRVIESQYYVKQANPINLGERNYPDSEMGQDSHDEHTGLEDKILSKWRGSREIVDSVEDDSDESLLENHPYQEGTTQLHRPTKLPHNVHQVAKSKFQSVSKKGQNHKKRKQTVKYDRQKKPETRLVPFTIKIVKGSSWSHPVDDDHYYLGHNGGGWGWGNAHDKHRDKIAFLKHNIHLSKLLTSILRSKTDAVGWWR